MTSAVGLGYLLMLLIFSILFLPSFLSIAFSQDAIRTKNDTNIDNYIHSINADQAIELIQVLGGIAVGTLGTRFIVSKWQQRKETSVIRQEILKNFQESIKDYLVLMDTFVAKILLRFASSNPGPTSNILIDILPFGYEVDKDWLRDQDWSKIPDITISKIDVARIIELIQSQAFSFPKRTQENKEFLESEFRQFEVVFLNKRGSITKFLSGVRQYYKDGESLNKELDYIWNEIMALHILVRMMIKARDENDFISLVKHFKSLLEQTFYKVRRYDSILAHRDIKVE